MQRRIDRAALRSYRRRLAEIDGELDEADHARRGRLLAGREALLRRVAADVGLGGRARKLNDPAERARKTVTARIRDAIRRIQAIHPELGAHLSQTVVVAALLMFLWPVSEPFRMSPQLTALLRCRVPAGTRAECAADVA